MTPIFGQPLSDPIPPHDHTRTVEGGELDAYASLRRTEGQTFAGPLVIPSARMTGSLELADLNATPLQTVIGAFICTLGAEAVTDARDWRDPDASGKRVVSGTLVTLTPRTTSASGTVLSSPEAGVYAFLLYAECTTAGAAGTLAVAITHVGSSTVTQTPIAMLPLSAQGAASAIVVCRVVSGDVTYAATITGGVGSPAYRLDVVPLGRFA